MKPLKIISIKNPVFKIKIIESGEIYVLDTTNIIRIFNENFKLKGGAKIKMSAHNPFENTADISSKGTFLAIAEVKGKKTFIWDIKTKTIKYKFGWHKGEVLNVAFDNSEKYLLTGAADSRAYIWSLEYGKMLMALPAHPDYILSGGFSKNNLWVATGSYDRLITITNITSTNISYRKKVHRGAVNKIKFFNKNIMLSADKTGEIVKWDFRKGKILQRFQNMADMVVDFDTEANQEFLFAITKEKRVYLYDFETGEIISQEFIKLNAIPCSITYNSTNEHLYVGCIDGSLYIFDLLEDRTKLKEAIVNKKYSLAYELIKKNPILKRTNEYKELEKIWEKTLLSIYTLLEKGEMDKAKALFNPFKEVPLKRNIFQSMLKDYGEFEKFKTAVIKKRYPLAYSLARTYPVYKQSIYYKKMEEDFKKSFNKARELIKLRKPEQAKEILKPFRGVSEKSALIQALFNEKRLYDLLRTKFAKREFKDFFALINRYPFLNETEEYEKAMKYAELIKQKADEAIKKGDYKGAVKYANILEDFPGFKDKAEEISKEAKNILNFLLFIANKDYDKVEQMVNTYSYLEELDDYKKFMQNYKELISQGEKYAILGDISKLKELFSPYVHYEIFRNRVNQFTKRAYLNQIISLFKKNDLEKIVKSIKNYIKLFGFDNEIGDLIKLAKKKGAKLSIDNYEKELNMPFSSLPDKIWEISL